jgi:hypothetical protein
MKLIKADIGHIASHLNSCEAGGMGSISSGSSDQIGGIREHLGPEEGSDRSEKALSDPVR